MLDVAEVLRGAQRISTFCHENPDGDTLGAAIAIAMAAERLGKQAEVVKCHQYRLPAIRRSAKLVE